MQEAVLLNERQAMLVQNFDRMNVRGQNLLLQYSSGLVVKFLAPTAQLYMFPTKQDIPIMLPRQQSK